MRQGLFFAALAAAVFLAVPNTGEAFGRRNRGRCCQPTCPIQPMWYYGSNCPPPVVWYVVPAYPPAIGGLSAPQPPAPSIVKSKGETYRMVPHPDKGSHGEDERDLRRRGRPGGGRRGGRPDDVHRRPAAHRRLPGRLGAQRHAHSGGVTALGSARNGQGPAEELDALRRRRPGPRRPGDGRGRPVAGWRLGPGEAGRGEAFERGQRRLVPDGSARDVEASRSVRLASGATIQFGSVEGVIEA